MRAVSVSEPARSPEPRSLVVQTSYIGDVVLTTALIARLRKDGEVDVVTTRAGAELLSSHPDVSRVIVYDKHAGDSGARGFLRTARAARGARRAFLCQGSLRSGALATAAGCRERIGFGTSGGRAFYSRRVTYRDDWHHARRLLSLGDETLASDAAEDVYRPKLYPIAADVDHVDALIAASSRPIIALAPGSAWRTKRWPGYGELAADLSRDFDIAIIGGEADIASAGEIKLRTDREHVIDACGKLSLLGSAELIRRAVVIVSNDSSPTHLASAVGTPTVTIFGPTVPAFGFGPLALGSLVAGRDTLACRPCDRHGPNKCPLGHWRCMHEISPMEVAQMARAAATSAA